VGPHSDPSLHRPALPPVAPTFARLARDVERAPDPGLPPVGVLLVARDDGHHAVPAPRERPGQRRHDVPQPARRRVRLLLGGDKDDVQDFGRGRGGRVGRRGGRRGRRSRGRRLLRRHGLGGRRRNRLGLGRVHGRRGRALARAQGAHAERRVGSAQLALQLPLQPPPLLDLAHYLVVQFEHVGRLARGAGGRRRRGAGRGRAGCGWAGRASASALCRPHCAPDTTLSLTHRETAAPAGGLRPDRRAPAGAPSPASRAPRGAGAGGGYRERDRDASASAAVAVAERERGAGRRAASTRRSWWSCRPRPF